MNLNVISYVLDKINLTWLYLIVLMYEVNLAAHANGY